MRHWWLCKEKRKTPKKKNKKTKKTKDKAPKEAETHIEDIKKTSENRKIIETNLLKKLNLAFQIVEAPVETPNKEWDLDLLDRLAILEQKGQLQVPKPTFKTKIEKMTNFGQISQIASFSDILMPNFDYKMATKQLKVNVEDPPNKQSLVLLIDISKSMTRVDKKNWVKAIIKNRLNAVIKKNCNLLITFFFKNLIDKHFFIKSEKEAKNFYENMDNLIPHNMSGITDIEESLKQLIEFIEGENKKNLKNPEILIVNDGADYIRPFKTDYKINAFILGEDNYGLSQLTAINNGVYERFL